MYGEEDRLTLMAELNYAQALQAVSDPEEAIQLLVHVLNVSRRVLAEGDYVTVKATDTLKALREST
jgi:hypothetical protein